MTIDIALLLGSIRFNVDSSKTADLKIQSRIVTLKTTLGGYKSNNIPFVKHGI